MRQFLSLIAGLFLSASALAATVNVSWVNPTAYVDEAPLNADDILHTRVEYGSCNAAGTGFGTKEGEFLATGPANSALVSVPGYGQKCFRAFTKMKATVGGEVSVASNVATKTILGIKPKAATGLSAQ